MKTRISRTMLLATLLMTGACGDKEDKAGPAPKPAKPYPRFSLTTESYENCDALQADVRGLLADRREEERRYQRWLEERRNDRSSQQKVSASMPDAAMETSDSDSSGSDGGEGSGGEGSAADESFTNTQEKGVDEADAFKVDALHVYTVADDRIHVVARDTLAYIGALDIKLLENVTLYTTGGRLIIVGSPKAAPKANDVYYPDYQPPPPETEVRIFDATGAGLPVALTTKRYPGTAFDTRSVGGRLILVFSDYLWVEDPAFPNHGSNRYYGYYGGWMYSYAETDAAPAEKPVKLDAGGRINGVPCEGLAKPSVRDYDFRLTRVISLNTMAPEEPEQAAATFGGGDQIYMTTTGLYVAKSGAVWYDWGYDESEVANVEELVITRLGIDGTTGAITPAGAGVVAGRVKDQWAFKQLPSGELAVATSTGSLWSHGADIAQNHLWVLRENVEKKSLDVVGAANDFGTGEDIRAVRYVGNVAYVVTFKKTDPLFAFDLTDPAAPKQLGELKIPGFSTYMHPAPGGLMLGVGFDAADQGDFAWYQGIQISLFDVNDPTNLARLDVKIHGDRGSYSDATGDHHAFFFDPETSLMAVPMVELKGAVSGTWDQGDEVAFSGAVVYEVARTLNERARLTHADLLPERCKSQLAQGAWWQQSVRSLDVNRVLKVDGRLLSLSRFGIKAHLLADPQATAGATAYPGAETVCQGGYDDYY